MLRARSDEAKAERLVAILDAAAQWFDAVGPDLTLDQVAATAGLTRTTLYGYAATREELLILLSTRELNTWFATVNPVLRRCRTSVGVARALADTLLDATRLAPLLALCGTVFERNISLEAATVWKQNLHDQLIETGTLIDRATRSRDGSGARLLLHTYASVTGLHSIANPPSVAAKAIAEAGLQGLRIDHETELRAAITIAASSFLQPAQRKSIS
jgi:AcrR family transcriptional regulator